MRRLLAVLVVVAAPIASLGALAALAHAAETRVSYLAGGSVYVDAGRAEGLLEGDTLAVRRAGVTIARLRVVFLSTHRASCDTLGVSAAPAVGDVVGFTPHPEVAADSSAATAASAAPGVAAAGGAAAAPDVSAPAAAAPTPRAPRVHGRIGARYLVVDQRGVSTLRQPGLDLRLDAVNLAGSGFDLGADVRGHHATRAFNGTSETIEDVSRVYRLALGMHDPTGAWRLTVGRQITSLISSVTLLDGALAQHQWSRWSLAAFSGLEPDPVTYGVSSEVLDNGAYLEVRQAPLAARRWSGALGGAVSSVHGQLNRSFLFAQGFYRDQRFSGTATQEVDFNSGWKREFDAPVAPTNTFVTVRTDLDRGVSLNAGYDNRRQVRLWRDRTTPADEFDDRYREGGWLGASVDLSRAVRLGGEVRATNGSSVDRSFAWTGTAEMRRVLPAHATLRARYSSYDSDASRNGLLAVFAGVDPIAAAHLEVGGGTRTIDDLQANTVLTATWLNVVLDVALGRRLQLTASGERSHGDLEDVTQEDVGLSWRF